MARTKPFRLRRLRAATTLLSFWATGTGWGRYSLQRQGGGTRLVLHVLGGELHCRSCEFTRQERVRRFRRLDDRFKARRADNEIARLCGWQKRCGSAKGKSFWSRCPHDQCRLEMPHWRATPRGEARESPWVIVVGGFLGAGKTTLLLAAAKELERRGLRSAVVLNDQSEGLVDTEYAALNGLPNDEVTGGCFCCRFSDLVGVLDKLRAHGPHVIFAEPVGSCTDISATTLHPLQEYGSYRLAPYTVLVDPERAKALLRPDADPNLAFLFRKQIEEADLICFSKSDLTNEVPEIGAHRTRQISAKTGQGVAAWLDEVLSGQGSRRKRDSRHRLCAVCASRGSAGMAESAGHDSSLSTSEPGANPGAFVGCISMLG